MIPISEDYAIPVCLGLEFKRRQSQKLLGLPPFISCLFRAGSLKKSILWFLCYRLDYMI